MSTYPRMAFNRCTLLAKMVQGKDVLDLGCVNHDLETRQRGHWLHDHLRKSAGSILGVDYEEEGIRQLQEEGYNVVHSKVEDLQVEKQFDVIVAGEILEHVLNTEGFLAACRKHLKPDGQLILTTPNANCLIYFAENLLLGHEIDNIDHVCIFSPTTMTTLLGKCGFEIGGFTFLAELTTYCHKKTVSKLLVLIKQAIQVSVGFFRPSVCHHFVTIARPRS